MRAALAAAVLAALIAPATGWTDGAFGRAVCTAQVSVSIGVDVNPAGNTATSLGPIDSCVSVSSGDTFQVDVVLTDVVDLLAWEAYFTYDIGIINILDRDVKMFQAANSGSNVFDASEALPDLDGWYGVGAADLALPYALDSGSGVLARLTLKAVGPGVSPASLSPIDVNSDGAIDLGPWLRNPDGESMADVDGNGFFDGPISNAQITVDMACPGGTPFATATASPSPPAATPALPASPEEPRTSPGPGTTPAATETTTATPPSVSPTPNAIEASPTPTSQVAERNGGTAWTDWPAIVGYVLGGIAALLLGAAGLVRMVRRRSG